ETKPVQTTARAPSTLPLGTAPTSKATPPKPTSTPSSRSPDTRSARTKKKASSAVKSGAQACRSAASPESIRVSPQARSQKGTTELNSATNRNGQKRPRICVVAVLSGIRALTMTSSVSAASTSRPATSVAGSSSRTPTLMNMNDDPQIAESASSMMTWRRVTASSNVSTGRRVPRLDWTPLATTVQQPLHQALGLTDGELERIRELLGRDPNHFD